MAPPKLPTAPGAKFFVHRYRWSHDALRKVARRARVEGRVRVISRTRDGWLYEVVS